MSEQRLPATVWQEDVTAPRTQDAISMIAEFLQKLKYKDSYKALVVEAKKKGIEVKTGDWTSDSHKTLSSVLATSYKTGAGYPWESKAEVEDDSDSENDSDGSDSSDESEEGAEKKIELDSSTKAGAKRKRDALPDSSDEVSSSASSDSDSSSDEEEAPPAKKTKVQPPPVEIDTSSASSDSGSDPDDSSDDSSSDDSSDSDSSSLPAKSESAAKPKANGTSKPKSTSSTSSSATLTNNTPPRPQEPDPEPISNGAIHPSRLSRVPKAQPTISSTSTPTTNGAKPTPKDKKSNTPFSRISGWDEKVDPRFGSNEYVSYDYADKAYQDLVVTKGKGFTKEKNKKKRGSYRGGAIDLTPKGIKFED